MLTISNIPAPVYAYACKLENFEIWVGREREGYEHQCRERRYTDGGLEEALCAWIKHDTSVYGEADFERPYA